MISRAPNGNLKVFSCNANRPLAQKICALLGIKEGLSETSVFSDREVRVTVGESVAGADVYIVQPTSYPVNDNLMQLLIMTDALKRGFAARITAVIPYFGYARQERQSRPGEPISARLVAGMIEAAGADRIITMDLHAAAIAGFFSIPVLHLSAMTLLADELKGEDWDDTPVTVVSPDFGGAARARAMAARLASGGAKGGVEVAVEVAVIEKTRPDANKSEILSVIGKVEGRHAILADDMIDTAGTITKAAAKLRELGAQKVLVAATHAVLSPPAAENLENSPVGTALLTDTIAPDSARQGECRKIRVISSAGILAQAISDLHLGCGG